MRSSGPAFLLVFVLLALFSVASADEEEAYFGEWSNAHNDVLRITADAIRFNDDKPLQYDDITEDSDGTFYLLQIKTPGEPNPLGGKFLRITFGTDADRFTLTSYRTQSDALNQRNGSGRSEWTAADDED
ncbi:MAG: hypothetical protein QOH24_767 [Verrucomicrobiota bacterium]